MRVTMAPTGERKYPNADLVGADETAPVLLTASEPPASTRDVDTASRGMPRKLGEALLRRTQQDMALGNARGCDHGRGQQPPHQLRPSLTQALHRRPCSSCAKGAITLSTLSSPTRF
jgi:hypothetical protein